MLNALGATTADPLGYIELEIMDPQDTGTIGRRVARVGTLDGGAAMNDAGFSDSDRLIELEWRPVSAAKEASIVRLLEFYALVTVSTVDGVFLAAPETLKRGASFSTLRLLVKEKLSA